MEQTWKEAAQSGDIQALYSLFTQNPNLLEDIDNISLIDTPLHIAASAGRTFFCLEILTLKPSFGKKLNPDGLSPLLLALQNGHISTANWLVRHDPELIRVQGRDRFTPLHYLADVGDNIDLLKTFISCCPNSIEDWTVEGETAVHIAVRRGHVRTLEVLLSCLEQTESKHLLDWLDWRGYAVLHVAAVANNYEVVSLLMKKVNINLRTWGSEEGLKASNLATDQRVIDILRGEELASTLKPKISFKTRINRLLFEEISSVEQINALLVAAALIVTASFQAVLSSAGGNSSRNDYSIRSGGTPGGNSSGNDYSISPGGNSSGYNYSYPEIISNVLLSMSLLINSITFVCSLTMIELLLQKLHKSRLLRVSVFFLSACYAILMGIVSPFIFFLLSAIGACLFLIWVF